MWNEFGYISDSFQSVCSQNAHVAFFPGVPEIGSGPQHGGVPDGQRPGTALALLHSPDRVRPAAGEPLRPAGVRPGTARLHQVLRAALEDAGRHQHAARHPHRAFQRSEVAAPDHSSSDSDLRFSPGLLLFQMPSISAVRRVWQMLRGRWPACRFTQTSSCFTKFCRGESIALLPAENNSPHKSQCECWDSTGIKQLQTNSLCEPVGV